MNPSTIVLPPPTVPTVELMQGSCEILSQMLVQPGWTEKRKELMAGGQLVNTMEATGNSRPVYPGEVTRDGAPKDQIEFANFRSMVTGWERNILLIACTDVQFQAAVTCLKFYTDAKKLGGSVFTIDLLTTFKLTE